LFTPQGSQVAPPLPSRTLDSIWVIVKDDPTCTVLLAAEGEGAAVLRRHIVLHSNLVGGIGRIGSPCNLSIPNAAGPDVSFELIASVALSGLSGTTFAACRRPVGPIPPPSARRSILRPPTTCPHSTG